MRVEEEIRYWIDLEARYPRDAEKIRKICTKRFADEMVRRVRKWHRRLSAEIRR